MIQFKLIFYVPVDFTEQVKDAIFATGAGKLGHYQRCSWQCLGQGQFLPDNQANPTIGEASKLTKLDEYRVEVLCTDKCIKKAITAMKQSHPYEEPAYEVIRLESL